MPGNRVLGRIRRDGLQSGTKKIFGMRDMFIIFIAVMVVYMYRNLLIIHFKNVQFVDT